MSFKRTEADPEIIRTCHSHSAKWSAFSSISTKGLLGGYMKLSPLPNLWLQHLSHPVPFEFSKLCRKHVTPSRQPPANFGAPLANHVPQGSDRRTSTILPRLPRIHGSDLITCPEIHQIEILEVGSDVRRVIQTVSIYITLDLPGFSVFVVVHIVPWVKMKLHSDDCCFTNLSKHCIRNHHIKVFSAFAGSILHKHRQLDHQIWHYSCFNYEQLQISSDMYIHKLHESWTLNYRFFEQTCDARSICTYLYYNVVSCCKMFVWQMPLIYFKNDVRNRTLKFYITDVVGRWARRSPRVKRSRLCEKAEDFDVWRSKALTAKFLGRFCIKITSTRVFPNHMNILHVHTSQPFSFQVGLLQPENSCGLMRGWLRSGNSEDNARTSIRHNWSIVWLNKYSKQLGLVTGDFWKVIESSCNFWLPNIVRQAAASSESNCPTLKTWKCASRHNGVQFFISHLTRPAALASLLFDPPGPQIIGKTQWTGESRLFYLFAHLHLLSSDSCSSLIFSLLLFSSLLWLFPPLLFHLSMLSEVWLLNFLRKTWSTCVRHWRIPVCFPAAQRATMLDSGEFHQQALIVPPVRSEGTATWSCLDNQTVALNCFHWQEFIVQFRGFSSQAKVTSNFWF